MPANEIKYLTQEELKRFFSKITSKRDRALFLTIYKYGLRASEAGLLRLEDVDLTKCKIKIYRLKNGISDEYHIFSDTQRVLKSYLKTRENDFVSALFMSRKKNPIARRTIDDLFKYYSKKARLPKEKQHTILSDIPLPSTCSMPAME
jgi:integrase/recombinase XerD